MHSSCHVQRVLVVVTKVEQGKIRVGNKQLLLITVTLIAMTVTQRAIICHHRWYLFLLHWIIDSSIHLICPRLVNSHTALHISILVVTGDLIARAVTKREMICYHWWYLCLIHWMIQSVICLSWPRFVNSHPALHRTQLQSRKLIKDLVGIQPILQIPCHDRSPIM